MDMRNSQCMWVCSSSHLEVVGQLRAASIARVHGDEGITGGHQPDLHPLKGERAQLGRLGTLDGQHLLGHHTQHLQLNTVELIKAGPSPAACQTLQARQTECLHLMHDVYRHYAWRMLITPQLCTYQQSHGK